MKVVTNGFSVKVFHRSGPHVNRLRYDKLDKFSRKEEQRNDC